MTECRIEDEDRTVTPTVRVYGGCIEPGGVDLEDTEWNGSCPKCYGAARFFSWERAESGSLNIYTGFRCTQCGASRCDPWWPGDED